MSDNNHSVASFADFHHQVAVKAFEIWQSEGRPQGCAERHWRQAEQAVTEDILQRKRDRQRADERELEFERSTRETADDRSEPVEKALHMNNEIASGGRNRGSALTGQRQI